MSSIAAGTTTTTGYVVTSDSTGTLVLKTGASATTAVTIGSDQSVTFVGSQTLSAGTANGVAYLNGSKVVTSGSALTFDGTNLGVGTASPSGRLHVANTGTAGTTADNLAVYFTSTNRNSNVYIRAKNTEGSVLNFADGDSDVVGRIAYEHSDNTMRFDASGSEQMRLTSTGLGIGTSSPNARVTSKAVGNAYTNGALALVSTASQSTYLTNAGGIFYISNDGSTDHLVMTSSGNLGLGVTPSAWASGTKAFQFGSSGAVWERSSDNLVVLTSNSYFDGSVDRYIKSGFASRVYQLNGSFNWESAGSGSAGATVSLSRLMTLDASGNLLVGTTTAGGKFHVKGTAAADMTCRLEPVNNSYASKLLISSQSSGDGGIQYGAGGGNDLNVFAYGNITFLNGTTSISGGIGTEKARIDSSGNLLVNTTASEGNAKIVTVSPTNGISARTTAAANSYEPIVASRTSTVGKAITLWYNLNTGQQAGFINIDSTSTVSLNNTSDYRVKEDIQPLTNAIARIQNLKPVSFKFKVDGYFAEGFIAHEFAEVIPQAVHGEKDAVDGDGKPVYQAIDQSKIIPLLTAAIQEQQALIETLTQRITALEGR
jgi:hypothetical protein